MKMKYCMLALLMDKGPHAFDNQFSFWLLI